MTKRPGSSATKCTMHTSNRMPPAKKRVLSKQKHSKYRTHLSKKRRKQTIRLACNDKTRHNKPKKRTNKQYTKFFLTNTRKTHPSKNCGGTICNGTICNVTMSNNLEFGISIKIQLRERNRRLSLNETSDGRVRRSAGHAESGLFTVTGGQPYLY